MVQCHKSVIVFCLNPNRTEQNLPNSWTAHRRGSNKQPFWRRCCLRGHRVTGSFPCCDAALEHFDVGKAFRPVFSCQTGSARFGGSRSIENDFLRLGQ
jgi:hypothetical protein